MSWISDIFLPSTAQTSSEQEANYARLQQLAKLLLTFLPLLAACNALGASVTLAWDASEGTNVVAYRAYYGPASGNWTNYTQVGNVLTATVSNLVEGATYYFVATAIADNGLESDPSNEVEYSVPIDTPFHFPLDPIVLYIDQDWSAFFTNSMNAELPGCLQVCESLDIWNKVTGEKVTPEQLRAGDNIWAVVSMTNNLPAHSQNFLLTKHITIPK